MSWLKDKLLDWGDPLGSGSLLEFIEDELDANEEKK